MGGGERGRGAVSTLWWWRGREGDMGGEGCGSAECFHFDQFYTLSRFFSHHKETSNISLENIEILEELQNLYTEVKPEY